MTALVAPRQGSCARGTTMLRWGPRPPPATLARRSAPGEPGDRRRAGRADLRARCNARTNALARDSPRPASPKATGSRSCAATTAASSRRRSPLEARRERAAQHGLRRPADRRGARPRGARHGDLRRGVRELVAEGAAERRASSPGEPRTPTGAATTTIEALIARGDRSEPEPAAPARPLIILTSGTTGTPKGAARKQPRLARAASALFSRSRCGRARRR